MAMYECKGLKIHSCPKYEIIILLILRDDKIKKILRTIFNIPSNLSNLKHFDPLNNNPLNYLFQKYFSESRNKLLIVRIRN